MDKLRSNKGMAMIELVLVIMLISGLSTLSLVSFQLSSIYPPDFETLVIHTQYKALLTHRSLTVNSKVVTDYPIRFNSEGHVNMGQTIRIGHTELVIGIASGRIREKSVSDD